VIVILADADFVVSVTEVAITVTALPEGTATGAVYVAEVLVMLLKAPQAPALPQVTDQVTPAFAGSLLTVAVSGAAALVCSNGGAPARVTEISAILMIAEANLVGSVTEVAVMVTPDLGTAAGAV
jgi:hypothetical protein